MFLAEKGIEVEEVEVAIRDGANLAPTYKTVNPLRTVPVLELDDGQKITESVAICRYFEALQPEPALFGTTPLEKAMIENWPPPGGTRGHAGGRRSPPQHQSAVRGPRDCRPQELRPDPRTRRTGLRTARFLVRGPGCPPEGQPPSSPARHSPWLTSPRYITVNFARMVKTQPDESLQHLARWRAGIDARPSVSGRNVSGWRTRAGIPISLVPSRLQWS